MPSMCRGCAAFVVLLFACAVAAHAQPQQSDPALPPKPPPPLTSPDRDELRPSRPRWPVRDDLQFLNREQIPLSSAARRVRERFVATQALRQSQRTDEFVPISELPPEEQMPAAPMLIAAYVFVVLALFAYLLSVSRRLATVKEEIARLESETRRTGQR